MIKFRNRVAPRLARVLARGLGRGLARSLALGLALVSMAGLATHALSVSPMRLEFTLAQGVQRGTFTVTNTQDRMIAVEVSAVRREQTATGADAQIPADDDFIVIPPQIVLAPGEEQLVRVQWIGDDQADNELAYRLNFDQIAIPLNAEDLDGAHVDFTYSYSTAVYVTPKNGAGAFSFVDAQPATIANPEFLAAQAAENATDAADSDTTQPAETISEPIPETIPVLQLTVENTGNRRGTMTDTHVTVRNTQTGDEVTLTGDQLGPFHGGLLLAGAKVTAPIAWPEGIPFGPVEVDMSSVLKVL